jgi:tripartite-type tricarboxylate transporter receptor subunit TctC
MLQRRQFLSATLAGVALGLGASHRAFAQGDAWPSRPVRIVVAWAPGGAVDTIARRLGQKLSEQLGQPVGIENMSGATGTIGAAEVARARPDGYTMQVGNPGTNMLTPVIYKDKFKIDYDKEVVMVTRLGEVPLVLCATNKDFAPKTYAEFIAFA